MSREKFKSLQKHWYDLLRLSGFEDIEKLVGGELVLRQTANHQLRDVNQLDKEIREEYFTIIFHKINDEKTVFRNEVDRIIMQEHAEGAMIREIMRTLSIIGESRSRASVRYIIRRYEVAWNIRKYTPRQLNKKSS